MMRYWEGQADMKWLNQSVHTHSWCETQGPGSEIFTTRIKSVGVVMVVEDELQSQPCLTIQ